MTFSRASMRLALAAGLAMTPIITAAAQELGVYAGGGVGGIRDVRRPFGGGISGTLMFHDWLGVHADFGEYWVKEHRTTPLCHPGLEGPICSAAVLSSRSQFPLVDAAAMLRAHIPGK